MQKHETLDVSRAECADVVHPVLSGPVQVYLRVQEMHIRTRWRNNTFSLVRIAVQHGEKHATGTKEAPETILGARIQRIA